MKTYVYQDDSGDEMRVCSPDGCHATVSVSAENAYIPAHRLAEVVTAMYEAAGQPAPALPDIPDAEQVKALAVDLAELEGERPRAVHERMAGSLVARGWRRES